MNKLIFLSRQHAAIYRPVAGASLISIHDRSEPQMEPVLGWAEVLYLSFHDTDGRSLGLDVFTVEQARQVGQFARRHTGESELVVHCSLGHSRSAAVALFLSEKYQVPCFKEFKESSISVTRQNWPYYNRSVYETLVLADLGQAIAN